MASGFRRRLARLAARALRVAAGALTAVVPQRTEAASLAPQELPDPRGSGREQWLDHVRRRAPGLLEPGGMPSMRVAAPRVSSGDRRPLRPAAPEDPSTTRQGSAAPAVDAATSGAMVRPASRAPHQVDADRSTKPSPALARSSAPVDGDRPVQPQGGETGDRPATPTTFPFVARARPVGRSAEAELLAGRPPSTARREAGDGAPAAPLPLGPDDGQPDPGEREPWPSLMSPLDPGDRPSDSSDPQLPARRQEDPADPWITSAETRSPGTSHRTSRAPDEPGWPVARRETQTSFSFDERSTPRRSPPAGPTIRGRFAGLRPLQASHVPLPERPWPALPMDRPEPEEDWASFERRRQRLERLEREQRAR
jgi:hypothetical protein